MKRRILIILALALFAAGCKKTDEVQTVDWYKEHTKERGEVIKKCNNNPGELGDDKNCINAKAAEDKLTWSSRKFNNPPVIDFN